MKKKLYILLLTICVVLISACSNKAAYNTSVQTSSPFPKESIAESQNTMEYKDNKTNGTKELTSFEELNKVVSTDVENTTVSIQTAYEELVSDIDTYDKYLQNADRIETFYNRVYEDTILLCIRLREYSINYAEAIMYSNKSNDDKYENLEEIYDCIYDDAGDDIYDEIYDDILNEIYDAFYNGILDDAYDDVPYDEWSEARSNEYERWSDLRSDIYEDWSDFRSDVYEFWSDMRVELWDGDIERAEEKIDDFHEDIEKLKNKIN